MKIRVLLFIMVILSSCSSSQTKSLEVEEADISNIVGEDSKKEFIAKKEKNHEPVIVKKKLNIVKKNI